MNHDISSLSLCLLLEGEKPHYYVPRTDRAVDPITILVLSVERVINGVDANQF